MTKMITKTTRKMNPPTLPVTMYKTVTSVSNLYVDDTGGVNVVNAVECAVDIDVET